MLQLKGQRSTQPTERTSDTDRAGNEATEGELQADDHSQDTNPADFRLFPDTKLAPADFQLFSEVTLVQGLLIIHICKPLSPLF